MNSTSSIENNETENTQNETTSVGLVDVDGKKYYYKEDWTFVTSTWKTINRKRYYFGEGGAAVTGWQTIKGKKYYFAEDGSSLSGWHTIDGDLYYFYSNRYIAKNTTLTRRVGNKIVKYTINSNGVATIV